jgi:hypothetical protein
MKSLNGETLPPPVRFSNFSSSWPATQRYPFLINSPCTNYVFALYSHKLPLFGAIHHLTIIADYKFHSPNVSALLATSPGAPPYHVFNTTLNVTLIRDFIYSLTANFFDRCPAHPNPLGGSIENYSLADLHHQYKKYTHKRPKHILLQPFSSLLSYIFGKSDHRTHPV